MELSFRQRDLLDYIKWCVREYGRPPSYREMRQYLNVASDNVVFKYLNKLEEAELIVRDKGTARNIQIL